MSEEEHTRQQYASFSDEELRSLIQQETEFKAKGFHPETLDLRKRGFNPDICSAFITKIQAELNRRAMSPKPPSLSPRLGWLKRLIKGVATA